MKDYLVLLAGSPRGGESAWLSLDKYVIKHLNADLALCTGDKLVEDSSLFHNADYKWIFPEYEDYFDYYRENFKGSWKEYFDNGRESGLYTSGSIHFAFKDRVLRNYLDILTSYKYIIYSRFDQRYTDYHQEGKENRILIPEGEDYFGICDRHAIVPAKFIEEFLGICNFIDSEENLNKKNEINNCETTFKNHLISNNLINYVDRIKRAQFTASMKGEHTNWRVPKYRLYLYKNLMLKYPDEFLDSIFNFIKKNGHIKALILETRLVLNYYYLLLRKLIGKIKKLRIT